MDCFSAFLCFLAYGLSGFLRLSADSLGSLLGFFSDCLSGFLCLSADSLGGLFCFFSNGLGGFFGLFACSFKSILDRLSCFFCFVLYVFYCAFLAEGSEAAVVTTVIVRIVIFMTALLLICCPCTKKTDETCESRAFSLIAPSIQDVVCSTFAHKWTRVSTVGCRKNKVLRSIRKPASDAHVQLFRSALGSPECVYDYVSPDRDAGACEKIPRPPLEALLESPLCPERPCAGKIFRDRHIAFEAKAQRSAQNCRSIDRLGLVAGEFEKNRLRHSDQP